MPQRGWTARRGRVRVTTTAALLVALALTVVLSLVSKAVVDDQEHRLLRERTNEVALVLTNAITEIPAALDAQGAVLRATAGSPTAFRSTARATIAAEDAKVSFGWLRRQPDGRYVVVAAAGHDLHRGQVLSGARARTFDRARQGGKIVVTPIIGARRLLGFALGPPAAPAGTVLYQESALGPVKPPTEAASVPFSELEVALYGSRGMQSGQVLTATTKDLPLTGDVRTTTLPVGADRWLLAVKAAEPLVGSVAEEAPWGVLIVGILISLLVATAIETVARRRDAALALYDAEHQAAETLQRSLLPTLPTVEGLDLAARYIASGRGQEVGGDWFDVFPLGDGRVGVAVGDVIGHDLVAASAMAQIRSALRAFAVEDPAPASVITRLARLIQTFQLTELVTVVYGVLSAPDAAGGRLLEYTNAGHLPPLLRRPDGEVITLSEGESVVIGAPVSVERAQVGVAVAPGATLVMFTDGLIEVPGGAIDAAMAELAGTVGRSDCSTADRLCQSVLAGVGDRSLRDDIALLVVRLVPAASPSI